MGETDAKGVSVVIVGAGQAAAQAAQSLRQMGHEGAITIIGEEAALPYQRPPLSKAYMKGEMDAGRLLLKTADWYADNRIGMRLATRAAAIDRAAQAVVLEDGERVAYDRLIIATGSRPRLLPLEGAQLDGVFDLRGLADVNAIRPEMVRGRRLVIIGAGYIGLEAAAVASQLGLSVTVLEMAPRVLERVTGEVISNFYQRLHANQGVTVRVGVRTQALIGAGGRVSHVMLDSGEEIAADLVLRGIGIVPNLELAAAAGLVCANGVVVDEDARTSDPLIFAAGDCTVRPLSLYQRSGRLESVHNAIEQGKLAAAAIMGLPRPAADVPWFWSDQYDVKLQIAGLSAGHDMHVVRGSVSAGSFAVYYLRNERLIAVDAVSSPADFIMGKRLIAAGVRVDAGALADGSRSIKDVAGAALSEAGTGG